MVDYYKERRKDKMAGEILDRLQHFLGDVRTPGETFGATPVYEEDLFGRLFEFAVAIDPDQLSEDQATMLHDIIEDIDLKMEDINEEDEDFDCYDDEEEMVGEAARKVRVNKMARRQRQRSYRKNKAKIKMKAKRYRKSSAGKKLAKKAKIMNKRGRTATGKRRVTYR